MNPYEQMRNSMGTIHKHLQEYLAGGVSTETMMLRIKDEINKALAEPPRNCDVGTAEEQEERWFAFCRRHKSSKQTCEKCPLLFINCKFAWSQLPYEKDNATDCSPHGCNYYKRKKESEVKR